MVVTLKLGSRMKRSMLFNRSRTVPHRFIMQRPCEWDLTVVVVVVDHNVCYVSREYTKIEFSQGAAEVYQKCGELIIFCGKYIGRSLSGFIWSCENWWEAVRYRSFSVVFSQGAVEVYQKCGEVIIFYWIVLFEVVRTDERLSDIVHFLLCFPREV